ncbi:MAG: thioesterase family protein [Dehalococcoidia bacterium]|nr:thioesterase family protein [Dehalococcoidia bacterium]
MPPRPGHSAKVTLTVTPEDTALALGSGDVEVLATPRLVGLCEEAAVLSLSGQLPEDDTSVGLAVDLKHLAPSPIGSEVEAEARLDAVDGRKLTFTLKVSEGDNEIARGRHVRVIVNRGQFLERAGVK